MREKGGTDTGQQVAVFKSKTIVIASRNRVYNQISRTGSGIKSIKSRQGRKIKSK